MLGFCQEFIVFILIWFDFIDIGEKVFVIKVRKQINELVKSAGIQFVFPYYNYSHLCEICLVTFPQQRDAAPNFASRFF